MNTPVKNSIFRFSILVLALQCSMTFASQKVNSQSGEVTLDSVEGRIGNSDSISCAREVTFILRLHNNTGGFVVGLVNAFHVYSSDSASFEPADGSWNSEIDWRNDIIDNIDLFYVSDGPYADTLAFGAFQLFLPGIPDGFNEIAWLIRTSVNCNSSNKTICLDTTIRLPGTTANAWIWSSSSADPPTWDGPHCFTVGPCCVGRRGDLNLDGNGPNILDLTFLVDYLFRGSQDPGACPAESDLNADGAGPNVLDLTFMVDYLLRGGPVPNFCP